MRHLLTTCTLTFAVVTHATIQKGPNIVSYPPGGDYKPLALLFLLYSLWELLAAIDHNFRSIPSWRRASSSSSMLRTTSKSSPFSPPLAQARRIPSLDPPLAGSPVPWGSSSRANDLSLSHSTSPTLKTTRMPPKHPTNARALLTLMIRTTPIRTPKGSRLQPPPPLCECQWLLAPTLKKNKGFLCLEAIKVYIHLVEWYYSLRNCDFIYS